MSGHSDRDTLRHGSLAEVHKILETRELDDGDEQRALILNLIEHIRALDRLVGSVHDAVGRVAKQ